MARGVATQLMFEGKAEEAMNFYVSLFRGSEVVRVERYGPSEPGAEGSVKRAEFTLGGHRMACIDSPIKHAFTFTPSASLFVDCDDEAELDAAFAKLSAGGAVLRNGVRMKPTCWFPGRILRAEVFLTPFLKAVGSYYVERAVAGNTSEGIRFFIGSRDMTAKQYGEAIRGHWQIENGQHWSLDVSFREDDSRVQKRSGGTNLALLRKIALSLLKRHPSKDSINRKRYAAALDTSFLEEILISAHKLGDA